MKNCYQRIEYLGYYEIIGGIFGISLVFLSVYDKLNSDGFFIFSLLLFVTLCGISIYSGILLIQKKYLKVYYTDIGWLFFIIVYTFKRFFLAV